MQSLFARHSPLAIHTAAFAHVLVLLAAGFALCFGESINLNWLVSPRALKIVNLTHLRCQRSSQVAGARRILI